MENIYKKIETELNSLSVEERNEILNKLRIEVDSIDRQMVHLISRRTLHSVLIGRVKRSMGLATYNPQREKDVANKISSYVEEPLSREALLRIYERILDESRAIQRQEANQGNTLKTSTEKMKTSLKGLLSGKQLIAVMVFFFAALSLFFYIYFTPNYYKGHSPQRFEVRKGESLSAVIDELYKRGIIPNKTNMKIASFVYGAEKKIRAARYNISNGLSYLDLVELFISGKADFLRTVKIYNGTGIRGIGARVRMELFVDSTAFIEMASNKQLLDSLGINARSLEGYLLPQTYYIYEKSSPKEVVKILYSGFQNFITDSLKRQAKKSGFTIHQLLTMASIVQGETNKAEEMPTIAGVYYNRLKTGMKLQADPTVQYLQPDGWKRLGSSDLKINSFYNTYKYAGLPPGPINNPGKDALLAAFYPAHHNYLYFVADGKGGHKFSDSYTKHLRLVKEYREWQNNQSSQ